MNNEDVFGSPNQRDATAVWERSIEDVAHQFKDMAAQVSDSILNRQLGSKKVPAREVVREWQTAKEMGDVRWMAQQLVDEGNDSLEKLIRAAVDREHRLRNA